MAHSGGSASLPSLSLVPGVQIHHTLNQHGQNHLLSSSNLLLNHHGSAGQLSKHGYSRHNVQTAVSHGQASHQRTSQYSSSTAAVGYPNGSVHLTHANPNHYSHHSNQIVQMHPALGGGGGGGGGVASYGGVPGPAGGTPYELMYHHGAGHAFVGLQHATVDDHHSSQVLSVPPPATSMEGMQIVPPLKGPSKATVVSVGEKGQGRAPGKYELLTHAYERRGLPSGFRLNQVFFSNVQYASLLPYFDAFAPVLKHQFTNPKLIHLLSHTLTHQQVCVH